MNGLIGAVAGLLAVVVALPILARAAQGAVPALLALLILVAMARLALPPPRRRR